jgi:hypothetical protein
MQTRLHVLQGFLGALSKAKQSVPDIDNESLSKGLEVVDCAWGPPLGHFFSPLIPLRRAWQKVWKQMSRDGVLNVQM